MKETELQRLNDKQLLAVQTTEGPLLILAGAGSGKTRVITHRIAHLLSKGVPQSQILAVTFTNKAAREMAQRVKALVPKKLSRLTVSTFHALGAQIMREKGTYLGYRQNFSIYDSQDQVKLLKETAHEMGMKTEDLDFQKVAGFLASIKSGSRTFKSGDAGMRKLYGEYNNNLKMSNAVDFEDLIRLPTTLLEGFPEVKKEYNERYRYVLVDEFQDTSTGQYDLMKLLADEHGNICVVGDDDQSIYSWRGANYQNILRFERDFPGLLEIKLEQNYRSTRTILRAANGLISHNTKRKTKELWSGLEEGEPIVIAHPDSEKDEAEYILNHIRVLGIRDSLTLNDFGVLVRANHLTRAIEEVFQRERVPYHISGGTSFFERQEVRDVLAYLKVCSNPEDDMSLLRIVNTPKRGLGRKLLERVMVQAAEKGISYYSAMAQMEAGSDDKVRGLIGEFTELIEGYRQRFLSGRKMADTLKALVDEIDIWGHLLAETKDKEAAKWKFNNVESLIGSLADFEEDPDRVSPSLFDYLHGVGLSMRDDLEEKDPGGRVNVMTIHAAKGLEFPVVFVAGVEEGIIPNARSMEEENADDEEERRLFYVAITRARRRLFLSSCSSRRRMGKPMEAFPSPFLDELPTDCVTMAEEERVVDAEEAAHLFSKVRSGMVKE